MKVELVAKTEGVGKYSGLSSEEITAAIARHGIIKEDNGKLIKYLMDVKHMSPLDMVNFVFEVETSRAIGRQILRHASVKFQEKSQRYSEEIEFEDIEFRKEHPTNRQSSVEVMDFSDIVDHWDDRLFDNGYQQLNPKQYGDWLLGLVKSYYEDLRKLGVAKECARMYLPECTKSTLTANGTLRSWLSFLNVRMDHHAQKECQQVAELIGEALEKEMPGIFSRIDWKKGMFL